MEARMDVQGKSFEEKVEVVTRLTREFFNSELFKLTVQREREIGSGGGSNERRAPRWLHILLDAVYEFFTGTD